MNKNYIEQIIGMQDPVLFAISYAFGLLGVILSLLWHTSRRNKSNKATPYNFSWRFLLKDNLQRIATSVLLLFIGIRFSKEIIGQDVTMYVALAIGLGLDKLSQMLKNKTLTARS
jgi:hypothetical protein